MDFAVLSRLESHSKDLFSLGEQQQRRPLNAIKEEDNRKPSRLDKRAIPPSVEEGDDESSSSEDAEAPLEVTLHPLNDVPTDSIIEGRHYEDSWGCMTRNIGKGFVLGFLGKAGVNSLYPVLDLVRGRKVELSADILTVDARNYGLFFGGTLGVYNTLMFQSRSGLESNKFLNRYRAFFAGVV